MLSPAFANESPQALGTVQPLTTTVMPPVHTMTDERLPFTVRLVRSEDDLLKAVHLRHRAYARHMPVFAQDLRTPEPDDFEKDVVILLAESKVDGSAIGTMRIQSNFFRPINMEKSVDLPPLLKGQSFVEVRRLGVEQGSAGRLVKMVLIKACLHYCENNGIQWAVVAARPPLDRSYEKLLFVDAMPGQTFVPIPRDNNVPHRIMAFGIEGWKARVQEARHPMTKFFCNTVHPDVDLGEHSARRPKAFQFQRAYQSRLEA